MKTLQFRRVLLLIFFSLTLVAPLIGEGVQDTASPPSITVTDALDRSVSLLDTPSRIVLAGRAVIMLADALYLFPGAGERVAAVGATDQGLGDFFPVLDPEADNTVRLGKSAGPEEILAQNPDLVLLKSYMRDSLGKPLETAGVPVVYLDLETPDQYERDLRILGAILKQPQRAAEVISLVEKRRQELHEKTAGLRLPGTAVLSFNARGETRSFSVAPRGWIQGDQVELGGGVPVWFDSALSPGWNQVDFEQVALWNPEVLVFISYHGSSRKAVEAVTADPLWEKLDAVKNGRVYAMPADFYSWGQPDTRWILGAQWMAYALHPDQFSTPFEERILSFFHDFYGMDEAACRERVFPHLAGDLF